MSKKFYLLILIPFSFKTKAQTAGERLRMDWAYIKRYENSNAALSASRSNRVVFMGDSITDLWMLNDSLFFIQNKYIDRGISGQTTGQMLVRFRQDVINLKPAVVVILAGINDIAENNGPSRIDDIMGNIISMCELAKSNHIKVVLCSLLPARSIFWHQGINPIPLIEALNYKIKSYSREEHLIYLDYFFAMADNRRGLPQSLAKDGVHPTTQGYKLMEPLAVKAINEALKIKIKS